MNEGIKTAILAAVSAVGTFICRQLGGWDATLAALVIAMCVDYITGLVVAGVFHKSTKTDSGALESRAGFKGIVKKGVILLVVWVGAALDTAMGTDYVRLAITIFFLGNEGISIIENLGLMGIPFPESVTKIFETLKKESNDNVTSPADIPEGLSDKAKELYCKILVDLGEMTESEAIEAAANATPDVDERTTCGLLEDDD